MFQNINNKAPLRGFITIKQLTSPPINLLMINKLIINITILVLI